MSINKLVIFICVMLSVGCSHPVWSATRESDSFRVVASEPRGQIDTSRMKRPLDLRIQFSSDVISDKDVGSSVPVAVILEPHVDGKAAWKDARTFVVTIDPRDLPAGTEIRYRVPDSLRDRRGRLLTGEKSFSFVVPPLTLLGARQIQGTGWGSYALQLEFSSPVLTDELAQYVTVRAGDEILRVNRVGAPTPSRGRAIRLRSGVPTSTPVIELAGSFTGDTLTVEVGPGLSPARGGRPLASPAQISVKVETTFVPIEARASWKGERPFIWIEFSAPVSLEHAAENIVVEPPVTFSVDRRYGSWGYGGGENALVLSGDFKPETRYKVTVKTGIMSADGQRLRSPRTFDVWMPRVAPFLVFQEAGGHLSSHGTMKVRVRSSGIARFTVQAWKLYENNLPYYVTRKWDENAVSALGAFIAERTVATARSEMPVTTELDLRDFVTSSGESGVYLLRVSADYPPDAPDSPDEEERYKRYSGLNDEAVIVLSNIGVVGKLSLSQACVWVSALDTARPIQGAVVQLFTGKNQLVAEGKTDEWGVFRADGLSRDLEKRPAIALVRVGQDVTYLDFGSGRMTVAPEVALSQARPFVTRGYEAFLTSERGAYRPGETVHLVGFVRGVDGEPVVSSFPLELVVLRPDGTRTEPRRVSMSPGGVVTVDLSVPSAAPVGLWHAVLRLPGSRDTASRAPEEEEDSVKTDEVNELGRADFFVEEFMPARLDVRLDLPERRFSTSEPLTMRIQASELFGQPAAQRPYSVRILYKPEPFVCPAFSEYTFGDSTVELDRTEESLEDLALDGSGKAELNIPVHVSRAPAAVQAEIEAVVRDASGRTITKRLVRTLDPVPYYIGLRLNTTDFAQVGKPVECRIVAAKTTCQPADDVREVSISVHRVVWDSILKRSGDSYTFDTKQRLIPQTSATVSLVNGQGVWTWTPPSEGQYALVAEGSGGMPRTRVTIFASAQTWSQQPWSLEKPESLELVLDKPSYDVGDVARLLIKAPFKGTLLLALEQDRVTSVSLHQLETNTFELAIPIEASMAPNVFASATVVRPVKPADKWLPHRAFGTIAIPVVRKDRTLSLSLDAPAEVQPDKKLRVSVSVVDQKTSRPAEADVVVWGVDEGVLAVTEFVTPDPGKFFYGPRRLGVATADFYSDLMPDIVARAPSAPGGGEGAALRRLSPVSAERIRPVVLWHGPVRTDAEGKAVVEFSVPKYGGRLRLMAMAAAGKRFGSGEAPVFVRGPVMLKEHFPRFLAPSDEALVPVVLYNNTDATTEVRLRVGISGPVSLVSQPGAEVVGDEKISSSSATYTVTVGAQSSQAVDVGLKASGDRIGAARISLIAEASGFDWREECELAVRPAAGIERRAGWLTVGPNEKRPLSLPQEFLEGTTTGILTVSSSRASELLPALRHNLGYPYGCAEQIVSRAFPLLAAHELSAVFPEETLTSEGLSQLIASTVAQMSELQTATGGLAMWPGQREPWLWASLYGAHFLIEAKKAGYPVGEDSLAALLRYIRSEAFREQEGGRLTPEVARERAYAAYVLALAEKPARDQMELLFDKRDLLPASASALLAGAYWFTGLPEPARLLLGLAREGEEQRETGKSLASPARETALLLASLLETKQFDSRAHALAQRLYDMRQSDGHWGTTQDNAFAVWALARFERMQSGRPVSRGVIRCGVAGEKVFSTDRPFAIGLATPTSPVEVISHGPGELYLSWFVEGIPVRPTSAPEEHGLKIKRRYCDSFGKDISLAELKQGMSVHVEISLTAEKKMDNVVVVDLLPACLEIENPNLASAEHFEERQSGDTIVVDRTEARDDRLILFGSIPQAGKEVSFRYACRVISAGKFVLPPAWAECMYDPVMRCRTAAGEISIQKR